MKNEPSAFNAVRRPDPDDESEHEKNRRLKSQQERILRKQLCRLRFEESDEIEAEPGRPHRFKD